MKRCHAAGCVAAVGPRQYFCAEHWANLPGRMRSNLSFAARGRRTPARDEAIAKAAAFLDSRA